MKLTIDTKEDSYDDIRKVLQILTHIIQNKDSSYNPTTAPDTTNMMNMFGDNEPSPNQDNDRAPDFGSFLNLAKNSSSSTPKREDNPKIEFF
ncbi:hypothetical protein HYX11_04125 [Candidatus Woesearchaeota archaeon]|nr:hypothetical protein [Candidatus Woesearchaeota archaeon]